LWKEIKKKCRVGSGAAHRRHTMHIEGKRIPGLWGLLDALRATPQPLGKYAAEVKFSPEEKTCHVVQYWSDIKEGTPVLFTIVSPVAVDDFEEALDNGYVENRLASITYRPKGNYILTRKKELLAVIDIVISNWEQLDQMET
jgi:hypothetical protein